MRVVGALLFLVIFSAASLSVYSLEKRLSAIEYKSGVTTPGEESVASKPLAEDTSIMKTVAEANAHLENIDRQNDELKRALVPVFKRLSLPWASSFSASLGYAAPQLTFNYPQPAQVETRPVLPGQETQAGYDIFNARFLESGVLFSVYIAAATDEHNINPNWESEISNCEQGAGVTINGVAFCRQENIEGGMESMGKSIWYSTNYKGDYYALSFVIDGLRKYCVKPDGSSDICANTDAFSAMASLEKTVMSTVRIMEPQNLTGL